MDLKKRIARTLSQQGWPEIELTFEEFGFRTFEWEGDRQSYAMAVLRDSDESALAHSIGICILLTPNLGRQIAGPARTPINRCLRSARLNRTHGGMARGHPVRPRDVRRVRRAAVAGFRDSQWTDQELGFCMARDRLIIPLEFGVVPYGFLGRYQSLPISGKEPFAVALSIFELLVRKEQSCAAMARVLVLVGRHTRCAPGGRTAQPLLQGDRHWAAIPRHRSDVGGDYRKGRCWQLRRAEKLHKSRM